MKQTPRTRTGGRTPKFGVRLRRFFMSIGRRPQPTETIVRLSPAPFGGMTRSVDTHPLTPTDVTNAPAQRRSAAYIVAQTTAIKTERRRESTDGVVRAILFAVGMVIIFGLAILVR